ncbi:MAG: alanine racemase [Pseudomonadota bacterium]
MTDAPPFPGHLTIDLDAIARNWQAANEASGAATASAVVKADGYGLGVVPVVEALYRAGCRTFFVALASEGVAVRKTLPDADIYVLNGTMKDTTSAMVEADLVPVLNDLTQISQWKACSNAAGHTLPAALMLDTGMSRLGLDADQVSTVGGDPEVLGNLNLKLVMSHLACADDASSEMNARQKTSFDTLRARLPDAPASLANSAGIFLGSDYHYDLTRPGICLYGASPFSAASAPLEPVVRAVAEIIQVRDVKAGDTIGYGATYKASEAMRTATIAAGYADGIFRTAGNSAMAAINGRLVPYVGRVSMDLIALDISALDSASVKPGDTVELLGSTVSVDDLAQATGTIGYEVLTSLGSRYERRYITG